MATLDLRLLVDPSVVHPAAKAAVVYRRWGGAPATWEVGARLIEGPGELVLSVGPPDSLAYTTLPPALGGPFHFAIGYILARIMPADLPGVTLHEGEDAPHVLAVAPHHRVLWMSGPFPAEAFERMAEDPRLTAEEKAAVAKDLGALPVGLSLVKTARPSRSLVGYAVVDEAVKLDANDRMDWPPLVF